MSKKFLIPFGMSAKSINFDYTTDAVGGSGAERQRGADWTVASPVPP